MAESLFLNPEVPEESTSSDASMFLQPVVKEETPTPQPIPAPQPTPSAPIPETTKVSEEDAKLFLNPVEPEKKSRVNDVLVNLQTIPDFVGETGNVLLGVSGALRNAVTGKTEEGDTVMQYGRDFRDYMRELLISKEERQQYDISQKLESAASGGIVPFALRTAAMPIIVANAGIGSALDALWEGADVGQAAKIGTLKGTAAAALGLIPGMTQTYKGTAALGATTNVVEQQITDRIIHDTILRPDQTTLKKQYDPNDLEKVLTTAVSGAVIPVGQRAVTVRKIKRMEETTDRVAKEMGDAFTSFMPETPIAFTIPQGVTPMEHLKARMMATDASGQEISDIIRQVPELPNSQRSLAEALSSLGGYLGTSFTNASLQQGTSGKYLPHLDQILVGSGHNDMERTVRQFLHENLHGHTSAAIYWKKRIESDPAKVAALDAQGKRVFDAVGKLESTYERVGNTLAKNIMTGANDPANIRTYRWIDENGATKVGVNNLKDMQGLVDYILRRPNNQNKTTPYSAQDKTIRDHLYGFMNAHEFSTEALTSPIFQKFLSGERASARRVRMEKTKSDGLLPRLWTNTKKAIRDVVASASKHPNSQLDIAIDNITSLINEIGPGDRQRFMVEEAWQSAAANHPNQVPFIPSARARSEKMKNDAQDRQTKVDSANASLKPVQKQVLRNIAYVRAIANTKEEFATRLSMELPGNTWRTVAKEWVDRLWNEPQHLYELAGKWESTGSETLDKWAGSTPFMGDMMHRIVPTHIGPDGQVIKSLDGKEDLNIRGMNILNPFNFVKLKGDTIAGKIFKSVIDGAEQKNVLKAVAYERAKETQQKYNELSNKDRLNLHDIIGTYQNMREAKRLQDIGERWIPEFELRNRGASDEAIVAYKDLTQGMEYLWSLLEQARSKVPGSEPLKFIPAYMPHIWRGPFKVFITNTNKAGSPVVEIRTFQTAYGAKHFADEISAGKHNNGQVAFGIQNDTKTGLPYTVTKFKDFSSTVGMTLAEHVQAYENMLLLDPNTLNVLERIDSDALRGMNPHTLERDGVGGWIGEKGSKFGEDWRNKVSGGRWLTTEQKQMSLLYQNYAKSVTKFWANTLFLDEHVLPLLHMENPERSSRQYYGTLLAHTDKLKQAITEFSSNFTGENINKLPWVDDIAQSVSVSVGLDPLLYKRFVREARNALSSVKLKINPGNYVANIAQPMQILGLLTYFNSEYRLEMKKQGKDVPMANSIASFVKGLKGITDPTPDQKEFLAHAEHTHLADPTLNNELKMRGIGAGIEREPNRMNPLNWNEGIEGFGRKLSLLMAYEHMKIIYQGDTQKAREAANQVMQGTMVNYDRSHRPLMYQNFGILGEAMSPFAVYRNAAIGNVYMMTKHMVKNANTISGWAPFLTTQATFLALAGGLGMIGVAEYDAFIDLMRKIFPENTNIPPKAKELFLKSGLPNWFGYGTISSATNANIGASMNSVAADDALSPALLQFLAAGSELAILSAREMAGKVGIGHGTHRKEWMEPMSQVLPPITKPWYNQYITGDPALRPMSTSPEIVTRLSPEEQKIERVWGKSANTTQRRIDSIMVDKETDRVNQSIAKRAVETAVEISQGQDKNQNIYEAFNTWNKMTGGEYQDFLGAIIASKEGRYKDYMWRLAEKKKTVPVLRRLEDLKQMMESK